MSAREGRRAILVIKLSSVGNVVLAFDSFAAIRRHHAEAKITLLTTAPYVYRRAMMYAPTRNKGRLPAHIG